MRMNGSTTKYINASTAQFFFSGTLSHADLPQKFFTESSPTLRFKIIGEGKKNSSIRNYKHLLSPQTELKN